MLACKAAEVREGETAEVETNGIHRRLWASKMGVIASPRGMCHCHCPTFSSIQRSNV